METTLVGLHVKQEISCKNLSKEYGFSVDSISNWIKNLQPIIIENSDVIILSEYNELKKKYKLLGEIIEFLTGSGVVSKKLRKTSRKAIISVI